MFANKNKEPAKKPAASENKTPKKKKAPADVPATKDKQAWTFTFSESVENHAGMQVIGTKANEGFTIAELKAVEGKMREQKVTTEWVDLGASFAAKPDQLKKHGKQEAAVLVIRQALQKAVFTNAEFEAFAKETEALDVDKKAFMKGRVVIKRARWNLTFSEECQEPDYENAKGRVVAFAAVPKLCAIREWLPKILGAKANKLNAELNYYFDTDKCGIGPHGDTERKLVVGARLGPHNGTMNLKYAWYIAGDRVTDPAEIALGSGDVYIMSDKAVGWDWKKRLIPTLRHAAGSKKFTDM